MSILRLNRAAAVVAVVLAGCSAPAAPQPRTSVRLPMGYVANVQYAPFYVALERGYFAQEGIDIEFDYKFETDGVKLVAANALPFAVVSGEQVVLARDKGLPVKYVGQWYNQYPIAVISLAKSGITSAADLKGKRVGLPGLFGASYVGWRAFLDANGLKESDVRQEEIGFTQVAALQSSRVDAAVGYMNNEPIQLEQGGYPVNVLPVAGARNMVANGLLTNEQTIKDNPALVRGMLRALLKGLDDTLKDPDAAMAISSKYVEGLRPDDAIQRKVLDASVRLMQPAGNKPGYTSDQDWDNTQRTLLAMGQIDKAMPVKDFYSNEFLP